ncbi:MULTISPECIES: T9SS type A sorting domain-containing protein [Flavobacterium]|uniref:T9SS type A sorting domain-containing protein n=1 Tax=Flavobacterium jumunjinense TaxID=998845 RepID=A0ABV5GL37_9FLAO|nr:MULTISPECIES: T9SS type A sorting domain-containing protein [Flavobacterium]
MRKLIFIKLLVFLMLQNVFAQDPTVAETVHSPNGYFDTVFDYYGNSYQLKDLFAGVDVKVGKETTSSIVIPCDTGIFELYFETGSGMEDVTDVNHNTRRAVVCQVFHDLSDFIVTPLKDAGNTTRVKIWVRNIANVSNSSSNVLGLASSFFTMPYNSNTSFGGIVDNEIWKTITLGSDSYINVVTPILTNNANGAPNGSGNIYHGMIAFNFSNPNWNWNTDLSNNTPFELVDLYSVVLHEVTHALGFASLIYANGESAFNSGYNYYSRYDTFLKNNDGTQNLITNTGAFPSMYNYSFNNSFLNTSFLHPDTNNCIAGQTTCIDAVKFSGTSINVPVFTPNCFRYGGSLSHFEDTCSSPSHVDNTYFVMSDIISNSLTKRYLKPEERKALSDIGYRLNSTFGNNSIVYNSFIDYQEPISTGINVAGVNDGIDNLGAFTLTGANGVSFPLNNIFDNDINISSFEGLEDVFHSSSIFSATSGSSNITVDYTGFEFGLHLLRYIPINSNGQRGNITYIYVFIDNGVDCTPLSSCNLVLNGGFEEYSMVPNGQGQLNRACGWSHVNFPITGAADAYHVNSTSQPIPCNSFGFETENNDLLSYAGMWFQRNKSGQYGKYFENIRTKLSTPLTPNTTYQLSFDVSLSEGASANAIKIQAYLDQDLIATSNYGEINITNNSMLFESNYFPQTTNGWDSLVFTFKTGAISGEEFLYIGGLHNVQFQSITPTPAPSGCVVNSNSGTQAASWGYSYYYIDNVNLISLNGSSFDLPNQVCTYMFLANLTHFLQAVPTNGVFTGNGVSLNSGVYVFDPSSVSLGNHTITYTYTNSNGCEVSISDTIEVVSDSIVPEFDPIAPICSGGSIALPTTSVNFINGTWFPAINNTATTTYTFTPNANQCGAVTTSLTVTVLPTNDPSCNSNPCLPNLTLSTTENNSMIIYKRANWIEANSSYVVDVNKNVTMKAGDYIVFNTDSHLKSGSEVTALIEVCTPTSKSSNVKTIEKTILEEAILNESIVLFPNPTTDRLTIASDSAAMNSVVITAMDGKIIYSNQTVNASKLELDTSSYQGGIYMVAITTTNGTSFIKKLVKN